MSHDVLDAILDRIDPTLLKALEPVITEVRIEYGGQEHYIYSARRQRQKNIRIAVQRQSTKEVAQRYRVSQRTAQRMR